VTQIYMGLQEKPPCCWHLFFTCRHSLQLGY